jgi:RNA polymerase sigma-70 factor (ECF subfamily)
MPLMNTEPTSKHDPFDFRTTQWTQVSQAKGNTESGQRALAELCDAYYQPVVAFLCCEVGQADVARDLSHEFFAQLLGGGALQAADRGRGRFRAYLLGAVKHFLSHHRESALRLKRGGGVESVPIDDEAARGIPDERQLSPDLAFDRQWALTVVIRALEALRNECNREGSEEFFEQAKPWLMGDAMHGDQSALAAACGLSPTAMRTAVHRLKRRFRECVEAEVARTLEDPASGEEEMHSLFSALSG